MKKLFLAITLALFTAWQPVYSEAWTTADKETENCRVNGTSAIKWLYSKTEGEKLAREQGRILLLCFCADWCGVCQEMEQATYSNEQVIKQLSENFITVKMNISQSKEAEKILKQYRISELPSIVFLKDGKVMSAYILSGMIRPAELISVLGKLTN
jgi:thiol:disulfide interchange protein